MPAIVPVRTGALTNGLSYYLERDASADEISVQLIVRAGTLDSVPSERETAHILEHIVFFGGSSGASVKDRIIGLGGQAGDANAFTSDTATYYLFKLPMNDPLALNIAIDIASKWIEPRALDDEEIARERQAVIEEGRRGSSPADRAKGSIVRGTWFGATTLFGWQSDPVGKLGVDQSDVRAFYQRHYRPANMALVITGPIDPEAGLAALSAKWPKAPDNNVVAVKRSLSAPAVTAGHYVAVPIAESGGTSLQISFKYAAKPGDRARDQAIELIADRLFADAVSNLTDVESAAVRSGSIVKNIYNPASIAGVEILHGDFSVSPGRIDDAMAQIFTLIETVRREGFAMSDFERARATSLAALGEASLAHSAADKWVTSFVGDPEVEREGVRSALAGLSPAAFQAALRARLDPRHRDIFVFGPAGMAFPNRAAVGALLSASKTVPAARLSPPAVVAPNLVPVPPGSSVELPPLVRNGELWTGRLPASGANFIYRRVEQDHVELIAKRRGGAAMQPGAGAAVQLTSASGLGALDRFGLARYLAKEDMGVSLYINANKQGFSARARADALPALFGLVRTALTAPQCSAWQLAEQRRPKNDEEPAFDAKLAADLALPRFVDWAIGDFAQDDQAPSDSDASSLCALHARVFGDMRDMTIALQGPMDAQQAYAAVAHSLDLTGAEARPLVKFALARETGGRGHILRDGSNASANVSIVIKRRVAADMADAGEAAIVQALLEPRLMARLRDREQGIYGLFVWAERVRDPDHVRIAIDFVCDPANADRLIAAAREELARLQREGASATEIDAARRAVPVRAVTLYDIAERAVFGVESARGRPVDDAAVNRWISENLRSELADHFVRLPALIADSAENGAAAGLDRLLEPVRIKSASDSLKLFVNGERLQLQGAPLFWTVGAASPEAFDLGRLGVTGRSTICLRSESGDACETIDKGEVGVFVVERDGREHFAHLHS